MAGRASSPRTVEPPSPLVEATQSMVATSGLAKVARVLGASEDLVLAVAEGLRVPLDQLIPYADALEEQLRREITARAPGAPDRAGGKSS